MYSVNLASMQQGIKKLQGFEYLKVVFLKILNAELCQVFANQATNSMLFAITQLLFQVNALLTSAYKQT